MCTGGGAQIEGVLARRGMRVFRARSLHLCAAKECNHAAARAAEVPPDRVSAAHCKIVPRAHGFAAIRELSRTHVRKHASGHAIRLAAHISADQSFVATPFDYFHSNLHCLQAKTNLSDCGMVQSPAFTVDDELANGHHNISHNAAADQPLQLFCPLEHENGILGGQPSLAFRLWRHLEAAGEIGIPAARLAAATGSTLAAVETVLQSERYFIRDGGTGNWVLAVLRPLRWGVVGCGKLAEDFAATLRLVPGAQLVACCDPIDLSRAKYFAEAHGFKRFYGTYSELAADPEVDIVHVAVVNTAHRDAALAMIKGGKGVLVEKTFAMNETEAQEIIDAARRKGVFCMEGMWQRFFPASQALRTQLRSGVIGKPLSVDARKTFLADGSHRRLVDPALGGGALLDVGCYVHSVATWVFEQSQPSEVTALSVRHPEGADAAGSAIYRFDNKGMAMLHYSFLQESAKVAHIYGTAGNITVEGMDCPDRLIVTRRDGSQSETYFFQRPTEVPGAKHGPPEHGGLHWRDSGGLVYEAMAVHSAVLKGWTEMPEMTHADTLGMARTFDTIRRITQQSPVAESAHITAQPQATQPATAANADPADTGDAARIGALSSANGFAGAHAMGSKHPDIAARAWRKGPRYE